MSDTLYVGGASGSGGGSITINNNHFFANNTARDTYFTANPTQKKTGTFISVGAGYEQWDGTSWVDKTAVVKGAKGDTGATGAKGDTGATGAKGDKGDTGTAGAKGDKGDTGTAGAKGDKGDTGTAGAKGDKGADGQDGGAIVNDYVATNAYSKGEMVKYTDTNVYTANADIPANTAWAIGTTGATWKTIGNGGSGGAVDSVNTKTGTVTLNQDEIPDGATYKQYSQTEKAKLSGISTGAQVNTSKVKASATDTTEGYLGDKIVAGTNITVTKNNSGANETYTIASLGGGVTLGETPDTAYRGDRGASAYTHSILAGGTNPHGTTFANIANKPTTVAGYGITDAIDKTSNETITGIKTFSSNIKTTGMLENPSGSLGFKSTSGNFSLNGGTQTGMIGLSGIAIGGSEKTAFAQFNGLADTMLKIANIATGKTATDGLDLGIIADGTAEIRQRENKPLNIYTNNALTATFSEAGVTSNLSGTWSTISDERLKENIADIREPISKIESIAKCVKHYNFINQDKYAKGLRTGYIAQLLTENGLEGHVTQRIPNDEEEGALFGWTYKDEEYEEVENGEIVIKTRRVVDKEGEMILGIENNFTPYLFPAFVALLERVKVLEEKLQLV